MHESLGFNWIIHSYNIVQLLPIPYSNPNILVQYNSFSESVKMNTRKLKIKLMKK